MTTPIPDDMADMSELVDANIPRVDLVGQAANGHSFIIAKSADAPNLVPADMVRSLIAKADDEAAEPAGIDITEPLADGDGAGGNTNPDEPGSAAWEAVDAASARKWTAVLQRAKNALETLADRESMEAATGDYDDQENAWDLQDAASAVDYAISVLAPFAVAEQFEAEQAAEAVGKAVAGLDPAALDTVEALAPIAKAGRTLSSANEAALRSAAEAIQKVLASLPAAPDETLTKEAAMANTEPAAVEKADALVAVYTQDGELLGAVNPADLTELSTGKPAPEAAEDAAAAGAGDGGDGGDDAAAADAAAGDGGDADARVIPGTNTVQSPAEGDDGTDVTKATADAVAIALKEVFAPLAKQLADQAQLGDVVKGLQERVEAFGLLPDDRTSPLLNGASGVAGLVGRDGAAVDPLADLKKAVDEATTPDAITKAKSELAYAEIRARFA